MLTAINGNSRTKEKIFFSVMFTLLWMICPVISVFLILFIIAKVNRHVYSIRHFSILIGLTFGLIAYTAYSETQNTDITRYTDQYAALTIINSPTEFVLVTVLSDGGFYIIFEAFSLFIAKLFPTNPQMLPLFWVSVTYTFLVLGAYELSRYKERWSKDLFVILLIASMFCVSLYEQEVELLKQSTATAIVSWGFFRMMNGKRYMGWIYCFTFLIHASIILFLPILFWMKKKTVTRYHLLILGAAVVISFIDINKAIGMLSGGALAEKANFYANIESWQINKINYLMIVMYAGGMFFILLDWWKNKYEDEFRRIAFNTNVLAFSVLLTQFHSVHNFVRYTYLYSPFYLLYFFTVLTGNVKKEQRVYLITVFLFFMLGINMLYFSMYHNSAYRNSFMGDSLVKIMTSNVYDFISYRVSN